MATNNTLGNINFLPHKKTIVNIIALKNTFVNTPRQNILIFFENKFPKNTLGNINFLPHNKTIVTILALKNTFVNTPGQRILWDGKRGVLSRNPSGACFFVELPLKPNPRIRLTRQDVLGLNEPELPMGISETRTTITLSSGRTDGGPKVKVSLGRRISSMQVDASAESVLGKRSDSVSSVRYELAPGYTEADKLCQNLYGKLTDLSLEVFKQLMMAGFAHVA